MPPLTYAELVRRDGASNYWRLDEATGLLARDAVGGKDGTISGGVTLNQPGAGPGSAAMTFNGTTGQVVTAASVTIPVLCTIELWLKRADTAQHALFVLAGEIVELKVDPSNLVVLNDTTNGAAGQLNRTITDTAWHHLAIVLTASTGTFYLDGVLDRVNVMARTLPSTALLQMGRDVLFGADPKGFWNGGLDEVAIYPVALTAGQVAAHFAAGFLDSREVILRNKSGHAVLGYDEATATLSRLALGDPYASQVTRDGASFAWALDDISGAVARERISGNDGTITGGVTLNQPGALAGGGRAMAFDGVNAKIATASTVPIPLNATVEAWFNTPDLTPGNRVVFSTVAGGSGGTISVVVNGGSVLVSSGGASVGGAVPVRPGAWHHLAVVFTSGTTVTTYIDGQVHATGALARATPSGGGAVIGFEGGTGVFLGLLDAVAVYPVALTPAQIAQHVAAGRGLDAAVEPVCWNKSGDPVLGYLEPTDALVVLAGGGLSAVPGEPILRSKSGHAVLGYNESTDQLSVLCQGTL